jgi:hypothetical protein
MLVERERAVTWWNPASQTRPVLDLYSFVPVPTLNIRLLYFHSYERESTLKMYNVVYSTLYYYSI